jgi:hypothetical protein
MNKISQALIMRTKYRLNKQQILESCEMNDDEYCNLQFEKAVEWIKYRILDDEEVISAITSKEMFWTWWINQWNLRNDEFVTDNIYYIIAGEHARFLKDVWLHVHQVDRIVAYPSYQCLLEKTLSEVADSLEPKKEVRVC